MGTSFTQFGQSEMTTVSIVGAGIVGATLAWVLAREGADVTVFDGGGDIASDGSLAWLNASSTSDEGYAATRAASVRLWRKLAEDETCPITFNGCLMWGEDEAAVHAQSARMGRVRWRSRPVAREEIETMVDGIIAPDLALFSPDEGFVDPAKITKWMRKKAASVGANFNASYIKDITQLSADHIVICAGNGSVDLLPDLPMNRSPGIVMRTDAMPKTIPYVMATPSLDFWQGDDGVIAISSALSKTPQNALDQTAEDALNALKDIFPNLDVKIASFIQRDRPIPADGFPLVGKWGDVWVSVMHSGMTLAPVMAEALADKILGRTERFDVTRYEPNREMNGHETSAL